MDNRNYGKILLLATFIIVIFVSLFKYRGDGINCINYFNSDATWHALYTIECYDETPIREHLFLPIVTLGAQSDKYIPWGACIPDDDGNYYYTSFSPAGYFLPWLFFKAFGLQTEQKSLYIFNSVLFLLSTIIWEIFLSQLYKKHKNRWFIVTTGTLAYIFSFELLHGMGIVYWHQSVMQITLAVQLLAFYKMKILNSRNAAGIFYLSCIINPYIEWTGYIANIGYAMAELFLYEPKGVNPIKDRLKKMGIICLFTVLSFLIFCGHYLLRVDSVIFFDALKARFLARSVSATIYISDIVKGYGKSFGYFWGVICILTIWIIIKKKKIEIRHGAELAIALFMLGENIIMKQHAIAYSYDRMKCVFLLSLILCELVAQILEYSNHLKYSIIAIFVLILSACLLNYKNYISDETYTWAIDYESDNKTLANYITDNYADSTYYFGRYIRGYMNLLFGRGIYEYTSYEDAVNYANKTGTSIIYIVEGKSHNLGVTGVYKIDGAYFYNPTDKTTTWIHLENENVVEDIVAE